MDAFGRSIGGLSVALRGEIFGRLFRTLLAADLLCPRDCGKSSEFSLADSSSGSEYEVLL